MDWQLTSIIVGMAIAVVGGVTGFLSTLLPIWNSRTRIKVVIPYNQGTLYRDEIKYVDFDENTMSDYDAVKFPIVVSSDLCLINLSNRRLVVYALKLTCKDNKNNKYERFMSKIDNGLLSKNPPTRFVEEPNCKLPLQIDAESASLVSIKFKIDSEEKMKDYKIHVYCQGKTFSTKLDLKDYSAIESYTQ